MAAESFSGCHPFRPSCLAKAMHDNWMGVYDDAVAVERLARFVDHIDAGRCPRCREDAPYSAGSRMTDCRCIPICSTCGTHEVWYPWGPSSWPIDRYDIEVELEEIHDNAEMVLLNISTLKVALESAAPTGGWAQHGYDDTADVTERVGR
jgi:hypothetical protein